jgi:hypothetical protein
MESRRGLAAAGLVLIGLVQVAMIVVMALSSQGATARSVYASHVQGRYATEIAESAVEECLANFGKAFDAQLGQRNLRDLLLARRENRVNGPDILGVESWSYNPAFTLAAITDLKLGFKLNPVTLKPLWYDKSTNTGQIEISAICSFSLSRGRTLFRRLRVVHPVTIGPNGASVRLLPIADSVIVDRSAE